MPPRPAAANREDGAAAPRPFSATHDIVRDFPGLTKLLTAKAPRKLMSRGEPCGSHSIASAGAPNELELGDDEVEEAFSELERKRAEWLEPAEVECADFRVTILGARG